MAINWPEVTLATCVSPDQSIDACDGTTITLQQLFNRIFQQFDDLTALAADTNFSDGKTAFVTNPLPGSLYEYVAASMDDHDGGTVIRPSIIPDTSPGRYLQKI